MMKSAALFALLLVLVPLATTRPVLAQEGVPREGLQRVAYDKSAPLNVKQLGVQDRNGAKVYDITYASPLGDRVSVVGPNGGTVSAYLVVPSGKGPFPAVVYGHWCMPGSDKANRNEFLSEAVVLASSGVISLLPNHVMNAPAFPPPPSDPLDERQFATGIQQVINLERGVDLLVARKDVDRTRLAYVGHSCDAQVGGYLSGIDKRFKAFVIMAGNLSDDVDFKLKEYQDMRQQVGPARFDAFVAQHKWSDVGKYVSHASPATVFMQYATHDSYIPADVAPQYAKVVSEPKKLKMYDAQHALNAEATRDRIAFLAQQLSFRPPDEHAVASIPELPQPPMPAQGK
jgi:dienelactone hydrolase